MEWLQHDKPYYVKLIPQSFWRNGNGVPGIAISITVGITNMRNAFDSTVTVFDVLLAERNWLALTLQ